MITPCLIAWLGCHRATAVGLAVLRAHGTLSTTFEPAA